MTISPELKRVYASAPTDVRYVETIQLSHSQFARDYYFTNDLTPWDFVLEDSSPQRFEVVPFILRLPSNDQRGNQDLAIAISNIGREMMNELSSANTVPEEPIALTLRFYLNQVGCFPQNIPVLSMTITDVEATKDSVSAIARRADILNRPFPGRVYTLNDFPGLDR